MTAFSLCSYEIDPLFLLQVQTSDSENSHDDKKEKKKPTESSPETTEKSKKKRKKKKKAAGSSSESDVSFHDRTLLHFYILVLWGLG